MLCSQVFRQFIDISSLTVSFFPTVNTNGDTFIWWVHVKVLSNPFWIFISEQSFWLFYTEINYIITMETLFFRFTSFSCKLIRIDIDFVIITQMPEQFINVASFVVSALAAFITNCNEILCWFFGEIFPHLLCISIIFY